MKRMLAAVAVLSLLSACTTPSEVDPDAPVAISGAFHRQSGRAAAGIPVTLLREGDIGEGLAAFTTLGLACLGDSRKLSACSHGHDEQTDGNGAFSFDLKGRDTQGSFGNAATLELTGVLPRSGNEYDGPAATIRFQVQTEQLRIPLRFWEPRVQVSVNGTAGRVSWPAPAANVLPPDVPLDRLDYVARFETAKGERIWNAQSADGATAAFDVRALEDKGGTISVVAQASGLRVPDERGRAIDVLLKSAKLPYRGTAGAPPSRGAACRFEQAGTIASPRPCGLTDGDFADAASAPPCADASACATPGGSAVGIDLGRTLRGHLIVVRGCSSPCRIETSVDAKRWIVAHEKPGSTFEEDVAIAPAGAPSVRYVRVAGSTTAREISVWDATVAPTRPILADTSSFLPPLQRRIGDASSNRWILIALVALALAAGLLGGYALSRRNRRAA